MAEKNELQWTIRRASIEFATHADTLKKRLQRNGQQPGADGRYSTLQISEAVFGPYEKERLRKMKEEADRVAIANDEARARLVDKADLLTRFRPTFAEIWRRIDASELDQERKSRIREQLEGLAEQKFSPE